MSSVIHIADALAKGERPFDYATRVLIERLLFPAALNLGRKLGIAVSGFNDDLRDSLGTCGSSAERQALEHLRELVIAMRRLSRSDPYEVWDMAGAPGRDEAVRLLGRQMSKLWTWLIELDAAD